MKHAIYRTVAAAAIGASSVTLPGVASAELKYENANGGSALFYGQFSPAYLSYDDGSTTTSELVDNVNSNTRVGVWLRQPLDGGSNFGFNFETALGLRPSSGVSQTNTPKGLNWQRTNIRHVDFTIATPTYGKFYAGQGSMASDGVAHRDLSGTTLVLYNSISDTSGSFQFRTTAGALTGPTVSTAFADFDAGRRGRIRYDSPNFNGFVISAAYGNEILAASTAASGNDKFMDVALRYDQEFNGTKVAAAIGWNRRDRNGVDQDDTFGSASVLLNSGVNFTVAAGSRKGGGDYGYGKIGYLGDWFAVGKTALAVDYYRGSDQSVVGAKSTSVGIGAVQRFDRYSIEGYLGYRKYELSEPGVAYQDANSVLFGARWKF